MISGLQSASSSSEDTLALLETRIIVKKQIRESRTGAASEKRVRGGSFSCELQA